MLPPDPDPAVLATRRAGAMAAIDDGVLLLAAAPERRRTADLYHPYRQDSDFDYLTGFPEPEAVCILAPGRPAPYVLVVRPHDAERALWVGPRAGVDGAVERYGASAAHPIEALDTVLAEVLGTTDVVHLAFDREDALAARLMAAVRRAQAARPRAGRGPTQVRDAGDVLHELRLRKAPDELDRLRHATAVSAEAHLAAMRGAKPGTREYELEALLDYMFRRGGAAGPAYGSIVAAGPNATVLHHTPGARGLDAAELVLIDAGAEWGGYCADVTRTFPVGPRFPAPHRDLYAAVLDAQRAAIARVRPGVTLEDVHAAAVRVLADRLVALRLVEGPVERAIEQELYKSCYMHRTSHWLGRDVHDVGRYKVGDAPRLLEAGMVFTIEPGCYVAPDAETAPEAFRGIGIRIEDDVLVTPDGCEVLTDAIPKDLAPLEALRAGAG